MCHVFNLLLFEIQQAATWFELRKRLRSGSQPVVGTWRLAHITPIQPVAQPGSLRQLPAKLYCKARQAFVAINNRATVLRILYSTCRTARNATPTVSAVHFQRLFRRYRYGRQYCAEKKTAAGSGQHQQTIKTNIAETSFHRPVAFAQRCGVHTHSTLAAPHPFYFSGSYVKTAPQHFVVIIAERVRSYAQRSLSPFNTSGARIRERTHYYSFGSFKQFVRICSDIGIALHISHAGIIFLR